MSSILPIQANPPVPVNSPVTRVGAVNKADVAEQFEAFVLQKFIEAMLPSDAENVYGGGTAGQVWKSMLAEKLAAEIAKRGDLGIASHIVADETPASRAPGHQGSRLISHER